MTTNVPIEIPGEALPAGTYRFKRMESSTSRNIVQVFDKEGKLLATVLTVPDYRLKAPDKPLLQFEERVSGAPEAIKAVFYPGENYGQEFVYPHRRATELAKQHKQNVLSMTDDMGQNMKTKSSSSSAPEIQALQKTEVTGVSPAGGQVALESVVTPKPQK